MSKLPYNSNYLSFITTVAKDRRPLFCAPELAERLGTMIHMACRSKGFVPLAYAILPDHLHLLVCEGSRLTAAERALESARSTNVNNNVEKNNSDLEEGGLSCPPSGSVPELMKSIKGTFSRTMGLGATWQSGYFCWYIDDARDAFRIVNYVSHNYQKSHLSSSFGREPYVWTDHDLLQQLLS